MSPWIFGDDSGLPKRCFWLLDAHGKKILRLCVVLWQLPTFFWRRPIGDPFLTEQPVTIEGVSPELMNDLQIVDVISVLSKQLSPEIAGSMNLDAAVEKTLGVIQLKLPKNVSFDI